MQDKEVLNLDVFQSNQAITKCNQTNETVEHLLKEAYQWLLVPTQPDQQGAIVWEEIRLQGQESPILRASRKLVYEGHFLTTYAASNPRLEALDEYLWRDANHINLKMLWEYLAKYPYLPRLKNEQVLLEAVQQGVAAVLWTDTKSCLARLLKIRHDSLCTGVSSQSLVVSGNRIWYDGQIDTARVRSMSPDREQHSLLAPDAIAQTYWQLYQQDATAWTQEIDLRPSIEKF